MAPDGEEQQPHEHDELFISDSEDEADNTSDQHDCDDNGRDRQSKTGPGLIEPGSSTTMTLKSNGGVGFPNSTGRTLQRRGLRLAASTSMNASSSSAANASGSHKVAQNHRRQVVLSPLIRKTGLRLRSRTAEKRRCIIKSPSPIRSLSPCSSGFPSSPVSTSTVQPVQLQPGSSAVFNPPVLSTPVCRLAPQSEFLSWIPSPSSVTHNEAYQQARILAARRLDLEIELQQTEELLNRMTKKAGKGKAKEE